MADERADAKRKVTVVPLKDVQDRIPRTRDGDPAFTTLGAVVPILQEDNAVLKVFTAEQVVAIVNRWIYQAEYQQQSHRERSQAVRDREKPVKEAFKRLFPTTSYINATREQIEEAVKVAYPPTSTSFGGKIDQEI